MQQTQPPQGQATQQGQMGHQTGMGQQPGMGQQTGTSQQPQTGQQSGQQSQYQQSGGGQQLKGLARQDVETPAERQAIEDVERAIQVCGWCADQCIQEADPMMVECIRLCEDVTELGETTLAMVPRSSRFTQSVLQTFQQAAQACAQECSQHSHAHCQECAQVLDQAVQSIQQLSAQGGQQPRHGQTSM